MDHHRITNHLYNEPTRFKTGNPQGVVEFKTITRRFQEIKKALRENRQTGGNKWHDAVWPVVARDWTSWTDDEKRRANALTLTCRKEAKKGRPMVRFILLS